MCTYFIEHIHLTSGTSYSVMHVRVAAQVLSIYNCLQSFVQLFNTSRLNWNSHILSKLFSIYAINVSGTAALTRELNPFQAPFLSTDDPRFS